MQQLLRLPSITWKPCCVRLFRILLVYMVVLAMFYEFDHPNIAE